MRTRPIYHITHVGNLPGIVRAHKLWSDARCRNLGCTATDLGYSHIKARRMRRSVPTYPGKTLGEFVPFNFCPRSVMLFVLHRGHEGYQDGQNDIVHLVSTVGHGIDCGQRWAFTDRHADLGYAEYFSDLNDQDRVQWEVMPMQYCASENETKECRQAEFLIYDWFPWESIIEIGVIDERVRERVGQLLANSGHTPAVRVRREWYY